MSIPFPENPVFNDPTGAFGANGQDGPVWFLAGSGFSDPVIPITRTIEVPPGKALFFPIVNTVWITTCEGDPRTMDGIRPLIAPDIDAITEITAEVDGVPVQGLESFRAESPLFCAPLDIFGIERPEDLVGTGFCDPDVREQYNADCLDLPNPDEHFGPADGFGPAMTDGIWLMLPPLPAGKHNIKFSVTRADGQGLSVLFDCWSIPEID